MLRSRPGRPLGARGVRRDRSGGRKDVEPHAPRDTPGRGRRQPPTPCPHPDADRSGQLLASAGTPRRRPDRGRHIIDIRPMPEAAAARRPDTSSRSARVRKHSVPGRKKVGPGRGPVAAGVTARTPSRSVPALQHGATSGRRQCSLDPDERTECGQRVGRRTETSRDTSECSQAVLHTPRMQRGRAHYSPGQECGKVDPGPQENTHHRRAGGRGDFHQSGPRSTATISSRLGPARPAVEVKPAFDSGTNVSTTSPAGTG